MGFLHSSFDPFPFPSACAFNPDSTSLLVKRFFVLFCFVLFCFPMRNKNGGHSTFFASMETRKKSGLI